MPKTEPPPVKTSQLTKRFRKVTALDSLNLEISPGDVYALLGANGSGKSTTFRMLLNIYRPSSGQAAILGTPSVSLNGKDFDKVAYISEGQKMPKWMRVDQFLTYCSGFYTEWDSALCKQLLTAFGLPEKQKIKHLSRGQCMKVNVASTLPARPRLLLLDEPFSGLDVETRAQLGELLKSLAHKEGLATIITTHDVEEVEPVANRLGVLSHGRLCVNEPLTEYLNRHRLLHLKGCTLADLPVDIARHLKPIHAPSLRANAFTESYNQNVESDLQAQLPADAEAQFEPMNLRQILTAHALPLS